MKAGPQLPKESVPMILQADMHKKMKIAIVAPSLRYVGGQSVQAELLMNMWHGDPDVEAMFVGIDPSLPRWCGWAKQIRGLRTLLREPLYAIDLWRAFADVDVAHIFASSYWSFLIAAGPAWLIAKLRGNKTLLNYHSGDARDHLQRFRSARFVLSHLDGLVVPSRYLVDVLGEFELRAAVVPNVLDPSQFQFRARRPLRPHLICSRGFSPYYKVDVVVRAFSEVKRAYPDARLDLMGEGPLERDIRQLTSQLNLADVRFMGVASRQEIGSYYSQADIFINASCVDAMPVSVIEAFRAGTPVVTTSPQAMPYLVEHERTGLLSAIDDEKALALNVIRVLRDGELATRLAENAYQESQKYDWTRVRDGWLSAYRGTMGWCSSANLPKRDVWRKVL